MAPIVVERLTFRYPRAAAPALRDLTFEVRRGEIFGFLGPSGAGKSTLQNILTGLLRNYQGHVRVLGREISTWRPADYARIGVAFELPTHFRSLTALENLAYYQALYPQPTLDPREALRLVGLEDAAHQRVAHFSKGMQNRLGIARALLHRPKLLFLDEPTSGLDPGNARRIIELIRAQRAAGATVFLTTHAMAVAEQLCDRVAFLVEGAIVLIDTPRALRLRFGQPAVAVEYACGGEVRRATFPLTGLADNAQFLETLRCDVQTIHSQEASLDDIFVRVTGRRLG